MNGLLVKFKKQDSMLGVTRGTLRRMATKLGASEASTIHLALARLAKETLPGYEPDEGELSVADVDAIRKAAAQMLPKGRVVKRHSLLQGSSSFGNHLNL